MARTAFIEDTQQVAQILVKMSDTNVRLFKAPASYYKMRKLENEGLVEHVMLNRTGDRGHALVGFGLTKRGHQLVRSAMKSTTAGRGGRRAA